MMHRKLAAHIRNPACDLCKLHRQATEVCVTGNGNIKADIMVIGRMPDSPSYHETIALELAEVGFEPEDFFFSSAIKCRNFEQNSSNLDVKTCASTYLKREIDIVKPKWILSLGNEALLATTGHSGITKYRGRVIDRADGVKVFPTISLANVQRNPGMRQAWVADLHLFAGMVFERTSNVPSMRLATVDTKKKLKVLAGLLDRAELISYDIETSSDDLHEHSPRGRIVSLAGTLVLPGYNPQADEDYEELVTFAIPLYHPESPFKTTWRSLLQWLAPHLEPIPKQVAHNGKFDARWLRKFGVNMRVTFDTMLAAHLLDENRQKGLKPQAASRLGVSPWAIDTKDLLSQPLKDILPYNAKDTYYTYWIYKQIREELIKQPRLLRIFQLLLMPANEKLIPAELRGVWVDVRQLMSNHKIADDMIVELEKELMKWVPEQGEDWPTYKNGRPVPVNFNPSIFSRWLLFDHLELPELAWGKEKPDGSSGDPSMAEAVMLELKGEHEIIPTMLKRAGWFKNKQFLNSYEAVLDPDDRVHTSFKLYGTVTGRLSSGKAELDKLTGVRATRGINLQQVPRDPFMRGLFGAAPGYTFVEVDFSQVELRVVAFLSRDRTMLRLYQTGQDIHLATAAWVLGVPASSVSKDDRKKAKAVNFGFVYGMGAQKFVQTAFEKYEAVFTLNEARDIRRIFFEQFKGLLPWHARMRRLANEHRRVQSPIGRVRHLPDIASGDEKVRSEAERQAINSPVQSFASDMNLLGMIEADNALRAAQLEAHVIGTVHDATLWEVRTEHVGKVLPIIKTVYENLPLKRKFGVTLDVPIVADIKVGSHWGTAKELTTEEVYNYEG